MIVVDIEVQDCVGWYKVGNVPSTLFASYSLLEVSNVFALASMSWSLITIDMVISSLCPDRQLVHRCGRIQALADTKGNNSLTRPSFITLMILKHTRIRS